MEKIWLKSYPKGVQHVINPNNYKSIVDIFESSSARFHNRPAFTNFGKTITFGELDKFAHDFAAFLQNKLLIKKGDRIGIMMPNLLQYPVAMFGSLIAGAIVVNINPLYTPNELKHQLNDSGATTIIVVENFAHTLAEIVNETNVKNIIVTKMGDMLGFLKGALVNFVVKNIKKMVPSYNLPNVINFKEALAIGASEEYQHTEVNGDDIAYLQYTGGTTGVAKGAMLTHKNLVANMEQATAWIRAGISEGEEIIITALPLYHIFSLTANCLTFMRLGALNVLITNPRDIPGFIKILKKYQFTAFTGVNTLFNALLNNKEFAKLDFSKFKLALGGGMAVHESVAKRWHEVTGSPLLEAYGLTETSPAVTINPITLQTYNHSIGLPLPSTEVSIRDDNGNELDIKEEGELCIRGPQVMKGYWQKEEETKKILSEAGWLRTGDVAKIDEHGFVYIVDRKKDMIIVSGFNVYPNEVEDVISKLDGVAEVAVVGVKENGFDEIVQAHIVKKDQTLSENDIITHCKKSLTAYKIPKQIVFHEELPKTNVGKILRRALRKSA